MSGNGIEMAGVTRSCAGSSALIVFRIRPQVVISEENVLGLLPNGQSTLHHELGHAIHRLGLTAKEQAEWTQIYQDAMRRKLFGKKYAVESEDEFFAELTQVYFDKEPYFCSSEQLQRVDSAASVFLDHVYRGGARARDQDKPRPDESETSRPAEPQPR